MILFIGLRVYGKENLPKDKPYIIVSNHASHLDAISLLDIFPLKELKNVRPVAASDYFDRNRSVSFLSHLLFNIISIERKIVSKHTDPLAPLKQALDSKQVLIFFPEGTRSITGELGTFHSGIVHIIEHYPELPIVPVYLGNMWRSLPKGEFLPVPFFCEIRIGKAIYPKGDRTDELNQIRNSIVSLKGD